MALLNIYNKKTKNKKIIDFFEEECFKSFMQNKNWNDKPFKEILTYKLLIIAKKWLYEHLNDIYDEETKETISDLIIGTYDIEINDTKEYLEEYVSYENIDKKENLECKNWAGICEHYSLSKYFDIESLSFIPQRFSYSTIDKKYKRMVSQVVRKNITRYYLANYFYNNSNKSTVLSSLIYAKEHDDMKYYFESLSDDMKKTIKYDLNNTIFLLVFILPDSDNENIHPHYIYLLFNEEEYPL